MANKQDDKKSDDTKEEELVIVGEGAEEDTNDTDQDQDGDKLKEKTKAKAKESADSDSDDEDEKAGHSESDEDDTDEEDDQPKKSRRARQREARERDKREIDYLRIRNEQLEARFGKMETRQVQNEAVAIDSRIQTLDSQIKLADEVMAEAIDQGRGKDHLEAQRIREGLVRNRDRLVNAKGQITTTISEKPQVSPVLVANAKTWMANNSWYKPKSDDADSLRVKRIDDRLVQEGYDPESSEYWDELTQRCQKALPHRFKDDDRDEDEDEDEPAPRQKPKQNGKIQAKAKGGPKFTTRGRETSLKANEVYISAERKAAMIEAGVWDDPAERQRYLKTYAKWDKDHSSRA